MNDQKSFLYKYKTIDEQHPDRVSRLFTHNELYFASADQFNDPFDCKFGLTLDASDKEIRSYLTRLIEERNPKWNRQRRREWLRKKVILHKIKDSSFRRVIKERNARMISEIGTFCLARRPDDILLWSHYADSHRGFCIKFIDDPNDRFIGRAQEVIYSKYYPIINPILENPKIIFQKSLLTKAQHWEYEREWRIIDPEIGPGNQRFPPKLLVGVIFGCRMSDKDQNLIRDWCKDRKEYTSFYRARESSAAYSLELEEI